MQPVNERTSGQRGWIGVSALIGIVLAANYAFDWLRRFDFEQTKKALAESTSFLRNETSEEMTALRLLETGLQDRFAELDKILKGVESVLRQAETRAAAAAESNASPTLVQAAAVELPLNSGDANGPAVFATSVEDMERKFGEVVDDPFLQEKYTSMTDPALWNPVDLLTHCEQEFGTLLSDEKRELLTFEIEALRQACHAAFSHFQALKTQALLERLEVGDFDLPDATGDFPKLDTPSEEIFAFGLHGRGRFVWEKSKYPEMYRWNCLYKYIPLAMIERVRSVFNEGRSP